MTIKRWRWLLTFVFFLPSCSCTQLFLRKQLLLILLRGYQRHSINTTAAISHYPMTLLIRTNSKSLSRSKPLESLPQTWTKTRCKSHLLFSCFWHRPSQFLWPRPTPTTVSDPTTPSPFSRFPFYRHTANHFQRSERVESYQENLAQSHQGRQRFGQDKRQENLESPFLSNLRFSYQTDHRLQEIRRK